MPRMPVPAKRDASFMNGVTEMLVLQLLARRAMYGYELVAAIRLATGDVVRAGEGGVYPLLHAMEHGGLLKSHARRHGGRERLYYEPTAAGRKRLTQMKDHWLTLSTAIHAVLGGRDATTTTGPA